MRIEMHQGKSSALKESQLIEKARHQGATLSVPTHQSHLRYPLTSLLANSGSVRVLRVLTPTEN